MENWQQGFWKLLENQVFTHPSTERVLNFYRHSHGEQDLPNGPSARRRNLRRYLNSRPNPRFLLVGEAPGPRGARYSGIPFTSEHQLSAGTIGINGERSSRRPAAYKEASATVFQRVLAPYGDQVLAWNSFPLLPHKDGQPGAIRRPGSKEQAYFRFLIHWLVDSLQPVRVLAVGRSAQKCLSDGGIPYHYVRHPSHGGARVFESSVRYWLPTDVTQVETGSDSP